MALLLRDYENQVATPAALACLHGACRWSSLTSGQWKEAHCASVHFSVFLQSFTWMCIVASDRRNSCVSRPLFS